MQNRFEILQKGDHHLTASSCSPDCPTTSEALSLPGGGRPLRPLLNRLLVQTGLATSRRTPTLGTLVLAALGHAGQPIEEHGPDDVEADVSPHEAEVAPRKMRVGRGSGQECICVGN